MNRFKMVLSCVLITAFWSAISALTPAQEIVDEIIAKINGEILTLSEFDEVMANIEPQIREQLAKLSQADRIRELAKIRKQIMDQLIDEKLVLQEAKRFKIQVDKDDLAAQVEAAYGNVRARFPNEEDFNKVLKTQNVTAEELRLRYSQQIEKQLMVRELVLRRIRPKVEVAEQDIVQYYEKNSEAFSQAEEVQIRLIQIVFPANASDEEKANKKEEIDELWAKAKSGYNFDTLARQFSEGPSARNGGDLGFFKRGTLRPEFDKAAFALAVGEISDIITTDEGYHIIMLEDKKEVLSKSLIEVKDQIREELTQKKVEEKYIQMIESLRSEAKIEILKEI